MGNNTLRKKNVILGVAVIIILLISCCAGYMVYGNLPSQRIKKQLDLGQKYLAELDYEQAVAAFKVALSIDPDSEAVKDALTDAYIGWAERLLDDGDIDKALSVLYEGYDLCRTEALLRKIKELEDGQGVSEQDEAREQETDLNNAEESFEKFRAVYESMIDAAAEYEILGTKYSDWQYDSFVSYIREHGESMSTGVASEHEDFGLAEGVGTLDPSSALFWYNAESTYYQMQGDWHRIIYHHGDEVSSMFPILGMRLEDYLSGYGITMDDVAAVMSQEKSRIYTDKWNISIEYREGNDAYLIYATNQNRVIQIRSESGIIRCLQLETIGH